MDPHAIVPISTEVPFSKKRHLYGAEGCGICEKEGADVIWFSPYSRRAHAKCIKLIHSAENRLIIVINELFKSTAQGEKKEAHIRAIQAVRAACENETILSYLEKHGIAALTRLFDTIGVAAVQRVPKL